MKILKIQTKISHVEYRRKNNAVNNNIVNNLENKAKYSQSTCNYITFGTSNTRKLTIPDIEHEEYLGMSEATKKRFRKRYKDFKNNKTTNERELIDAKYQYLPLQLEKTMDDFIKISSIYSKYKKNPIICLGRSPKWFLNAALWMEDGIKNYTYVAFSGFWYRPDSKEGLVRMNAVAPKPEELEAYKKYLKRIKADPKSIVEEMKKNGEKTVITDYIHSGKGACSFMEIMGNMAKEQGVLKEFSESIQIVGIGSRDYLEEMNPYADSISDPFVPMPEVLWPYEKNIKQEFYNMDYNVFCEMLLNQNSNECRSTYYPSSAWTIYKPDQFKTGLIKDVKKLEGVIKRLSHKKCVTSFSPAMRDYRNLLNFRILDGLNARGLLKKIHKSKV